MFTKISKIQTVFLGLTLLFVGMNVVDAQNRNDKARQDFIEREHRESDQAARENEQKDRNDRAMQNFNEREHRERDQAAREKEQKDRNDRAMQNFNEREHREGDQAAREKEQTDRNDRAMQNFIEREHREGDQAARERENESRQRQDMARFREFEKRQYEQYNGDKPSQQSPTSSEEWNRRANPVINGRTYSVRERYGNQSVFGFFSPPSNLGHSYDLYESLGRRNLSAKQVFDILFRDLNSPFPIRAVGVNGQEIVKGNKFVLSLGGYFGNTVEVVDATETSFTLRAVGGQHTFQGTVTHQVIKDSSGEVWLRHTGHGLPGENKQLQGWNYTAADAMWRRMAFVSMQILSSTPQR